MNESAAPAISDVKVTARALEVRLADGRELSVPLEWYPRLKHGTRAERRHWQLIACGTGIHWPDLDEDISVAGLLSGLRSGERSSSVKRWLHARARPSNTLMHPPAAVREKRATYKTGKRRRG